MIIRRAGVVCEHSAQSISALPPPQTKKIVPLIIPFLPILHVRLSPPPSPTFPHPSS